MNQFQNTHIILTLKLVNFKQFLLRKFANFPCASFQITNHPLFPSLGDDFNAEDGGPESKEEPAEIAIDDREIEFKAALHGILMHGSVEESVQAKSTLVHRNLRP